jgi:hypothetical protein
VCITINPDTTVIGVHMKLWEYKLDLSANWNKDWDDNSVNLLGMFVSEKLKELSKTNLLLMNDDELEELIYLFSQVCTKEQAESINNKEWDYLVSVGKEFDYNDLIPTEEFDGYMETLYNWTDINRVWIAR